MLAAEDALRLEIENRKSAEEKLKASAGGGVGMYGQIEKKN